MHRQRWARGILCLHRDGRLGMLVLGKVWAMGLAARLVLGSAGSRVEAM